MRESSSARPASGSTGRGLRGAAGGKGATDGAAGASASPGHCIGSSAPGRDGRGAGSARKLGSTRGAPSGLGAVSGCSGHMVSSPSGTARGSVSVAAGRAGARAAPAARTMFCSTTTSVGPPMMRRCSTLSRRMSTRRRRLSIAAWSIRARRGCRPRADALPRRPPPNRRSSQNATASRPSTTTRNSRILGPVCPSPNKVSKITPPCVPRGVAFRSGSPEWLTPLAISVAVNTNKQLAPDPIKGS